jgi:hypothetical protein
VGKLRMCLMMVSSMDLSGEDLCIMSTYSRGTLSQEVHSNTIPTSTMMDLLTREKVAIMNESEVNQIVQAMKASSRLLVHGKIFRNQNTCILTSLGLIKDRITLLHDINKEQAVVILLIGLENPGLHVFGRVSGIHWWLEGEVLWRLGGGYHLLLPLWLEVVSQRSNLLEFLDINKEQEL